jgi:hypothetical protein
MMKATVMEIIVVTKDQISIFPPKRLRSLAEKFDRLDMIENMTSGTSRRESEFLIFLHCTLTYSLVTIKFF